MRVAFRTLSFSASEIAAFEDCAARYYHGQQQYGSGLLPTDRTPADVASAVHNGLMDFQRQLEQASRRGSLPPASTRRGVFETLLDRQLRRKRLDRRSAGVADRLANLDRGIDQALDLIAADFPKWAIDSRNGDLLVWAENGLNHGPDVAAVELEPGMLVRTRPDVIGLLDDGSGHCRAVVRDFKAKANAVVDPAFDIGILVRGFWALVEMRQPRCRWFLAGREVPVSEPGVSMSTGKEIGMKDERVLLTILNHHKLDPPKIEGGPDRYVGYYCNMYGEQLVFMFDWATNRGTLYHGDADWQPYPVRDGVAPGLIMHETEESWLRACWFAAVPAARG